MKLSRAIAIFASVAFSGIAFQSAIACNANSEENFDHMITIVKNLNEKNPDTDFYNFYTGSCVKVSSLKTDAQVSKLLPNDETSLGLFTLFRSRGETPLRSLKDVYKFNQAHS